MIYIKKIALVSTVIAVLGILAIAQSGNSDLITGMVGYKMAGHSNPSFVVGFIVLKLAAVALVSLIFSVIFWKSYKMVVKKK